VPDTTTWLTPEQLAERIQVPVKTLNDWRYKGYGPKFIKLGPARSSHVRYKLTDVLQWEASSTASPDASAGDPTSKALAALLKAGFGVVIEQAGGGAQVTVSGPRKLRGHGSTPGEAVALVREQALS
jgi:hypothetical protein